MQQLIGKQHLILFILLLCLSIPSRLAASSDWRAWLYHPQNGQLIQIDSHGNQRVNTTIHTQLNPEQVIISPNSQLVAYVVSNPRTFEHELVLHDLVNQRNLSSTHLPQPQYGLFNQDDRLHLSRYTFNDSSTRLAYSVFIAGEGWEIRVVDCLTGELLVRMTDRSPVLAPFPDIHSGTMPYIQRFNENEIAFTIDNGSSPLTLHSNFIWSFADNSLRQSNIYRVFETDTLRASGEVIMPLPDHRFAASNKDVIRPRLQHNTLQMADPLSQTRAPFFTDEALDFQAVQFIQNGEQFLITAQVDRLRSRWLVVNRAGERVRSLPVAGDEVAGSPDGFAYLAIVGNQTALVHVDTRNFTSLGETIWVSKGIWHLIDVPMERTPNLPVPPSLAEPLQMPDSVKNSLTPFPLPPPMLNVDMDVQIQTFDDDYINLRESPSTSGQVLALLENGVLMTLLDGPIEADGYTWWQVRVGKRVGWLVERIGDLQAIIPRRPPED